MKDVTNFTRSKRLALRTAFDFLQGKIAGIKTPHWAKNLVFFSRMTSDGIHITDGDEVIARNFYFDVGKRVVFQVLLEGANIDEDDPDNGKQLNPTEIRWRDKGKWHSLRLDQ